MKTSTQIVNRYSTIALVFGYACGRVALAEPTVIAHIDSAPVHAIIGPVMFGFASTRFTDQLGNQEMAIRRRVELARPTKKITLLIEGLLQAKDSSGKLANPGQYWQDLRCSHIKSGEARRGPLTKATPIDSPGIQLHVLGAAGTLSTISISDLMAGKQVEGAKLIKASFRQARLMFTLESGVDINALEFDTTGLDHDYLGLLRAHVMGEPESEVSVVFEEYGSKGSYESPVQTLVCPTMTYVELCNTRPPTISRTNYRWQGQFLIPVGIKLAHPNSAMTSRWIKGLAPQKEVKATVRGVFVFSGFSIEGNQGESQVGGGGGGQDFQYRFDHLRSLRPPIYPNKSSVFDASLKIHWADREQYLVQSVDGSWIPHLESLADFQLDHVYRIKFAPKAGSTEVAFEVIDGGTLERTWDNAGGLFMTVEK